MSIKPLRTSAVVREVRLLWLFLLAVAALLVALRWESRREIETLERSRLAVQARTIEQNLTRQFAGVRNALRDLRASLAAWAPADRTAQAGERLQALCVAIPGLRAMRWVDGQGRLVAANRQAGASVGTDLSDQAWFQSLRQHPDAGQLVLSEPRADTDGRFSVELSLALLDDQGRWNGALTATLDADYFNTLLASVRYADDMWALVAHTRGQLLVMVPALPAAAGLSVDRPGSLLSRHLASGEVASVLSGVSVIGGDERLAAQRTMTAPELALSGSLVVSASRSREVIFGAWSRLNLLLAALYAAFAIASWLALKARHRSQEEASRQRERETQEANRLALALNGGNLALWDADLQTGRGHVNDRWHEMLGFHAGEVAADQAGWQDLIHPEDQARVVAAQDAHLRGESPSYEAQYRLRHKDGRWIWVLDRGRVVQRDAAGNALRFVGTHLDISARVEADEALRERSEQLALVTDMLPGPVARLDLQRRFLFGNAAFREWFGVEPAALSGRTCREALGDEVAASLDMLVVQALQGAMQRTDLLLPTRNGPRDVIATLMPERDAAGAVRGVLALIIDITERKRTEEELRLLEAAVAGLDDMVLITEAEPLEEPGPRIIFVNAAFERFTGWRREDVLGRSPRFLRHANTSVAELQRVDVALARGESVRTELLNQTRDGREYWVDIAIAPLRNPAGRVTHIVSVHRDATDRRRAAAAVQDAQRELAATLAAVPDLLFDLDAEGLIHGYHSPRHDLLLLAPQNIVGQRVQDTLPPDAVQVVRQALDEAGAEGYSGGLQYPLPLPQGTRWFELSVSAKNAPGLADAGQPRRFIALARDVTERRQAEAERQVLESQLREAQKIESIGTLAGGIAHDFNNILAAILGNVALASGDLPADHAAQFSLEQIRKGSLRARALVQQILTFSRRQLNPLKVQPLQPVVEETVALLRATLPAAVRVDTRLAALPLWLQADATQLQQVLMNLCTNAWHALPEHGGTIEIGCEALADGEPSLSQEAALAGRPLLHLWVRDDGCGMDAETRDRIFDPFYTTKPVGQGTGLGLSVVHGIVRSHSGAVRVDSQLQQGSTFHLYFPAAPEPGGEAASAEARESQAGGCGQQILYVDDDEVMLLMVQRLLQRQGYEVLVCGQARQALALLRAEPQRFDLLISDFNMPELSGLELARQLQALRPQLPLIITSGYITDELREKAAALGVKALLNKEKTIEELAGLVQQVLAD